MYNTFLSTLCAIFHLTKTCAAAGSYASALREVTREKHAESVNIEEEIDVEGVNTAERKGEGFQGGGNVNVSGEGDEIGETAAGTVQLASPVGGDRASVESAVATTEQPVVAKKRVG